MTAQIKISSTTLTVDGKRVGVRYAVGPWVEGVDPSTIKIRSRKSRFPAEVRAAFTIENNSDSREDYFEGDSIRITARHPLYAAVKAAAEAV